MAIGLLVESAIAPGKVGDLRALVARVCEHCESTEPGMLQYDWFINADETRLRVVESYADSDALRDHGQNCAPFQAELGECRTIERIDVLGDADDQLREALGSRGANFFDALASVPR